MAPRKPKEGPATLVAADDLDALRAGLAKELGKELGGKIYMGDAERLKLKKLPTGIEAFDRVLGGGVAFDRIAVVIGEFSAGKTTFALMVAKAAQAANLSVAYIDVERAWNAEWAASLGLDPEKVLVIRPTTGEQAGNAAVALLKRRVGVIIIDSLAAIMPGAELETAEDEMFEKKFIGNQPQLVNRILRDMVAVMDGTLIVAINQLRDGVGVMFGNPETLPGGRGQRFYSWQILRIRRGAWIEEGKGDDKHRVGYKMRLIVEKNKQAAPFQQAEAAFYFTGEFDELAGLIELCMELDIIHAEPPNYYLGWTEDGTYETKVYGRQNLVDMIREDPELQAKLRAAVDEVPEVEI